MVKTFFTADHHFDHYNIIKYCNRPFNTVNEMNRTLIDNWNSTVEDSDIVYHLGDFALVEVGEGGVTRLNELVEALNGEIHLIYGNHDNANNIVRSKIPLSLTVTNIIHKGQKIILSHYPPTDWCVSGGAWWLYGHTHNGKQREDGSPYLNVGVDCWGYTPISLDKVVEMCE